jgi:hypothetical protein
LESRSTSEERKCAVEQNLPFGLSKSYIIKAQSMLNDTERMEKMADDTPNWQADPTARAALGSFRTV